MGLLTGDDGKKANNVVQETDAEKTQRSRANAASDSRTAQLMSDYGSGKISLQDALSQAQSLGSTMGGTAGAKQLQDMLATDPQAAQRFATDSVQNDAVLGKYFGKGGMQDQVLGAQAGLDKNLADDRQDLMGKGESYGLTDNDLKAYGQASDNIARMYGQQEQSLASALSDRGLSAGASGSAGAQFSGLQGNKMEQLAQMQQQIAQNRIQTAKGLAEFRTQADAQQAARNQQAALSLGELGDHAIANARNQNQAGYNANNANLAQAAGQQRALNDDQQSQENIGFAQQQATRKKGLFEQVGDAFNAGIASDVGAAAGAPGKAINTALGGSDGKGTTGSAGSMLSSLL